MSGTWLPGRTKITSLDAHLIRKDFEEYKRREPMVGPCYQRLADEYGVHPRTIERIIRNHTHVQAQPDS